MKLRISNHKSITINFDKIMLFLTILLLNRIFSFDAATTTRFRLIVGTVVFIYLSFKGSFSIVKYNFTVVLYIISILLAGVINFGFNSDLLLTLITIITVFDVIIMPVYFIKKYGFSESISTLFVMILFIILIDDLSVFGILFDGVKNIDAQLYFTGSKFSVSYLHLLFVALTGTLFIQKKKNLLKQKFWIFLLCIYSCYICYLAECSTGIVGISIIGLIFLFSKTSSPMLYKPATYLIILLGINFLFVFSDVILTSDLFSWLLNFLGEDSSLTGRTDIYARLFYIIKGSPTYGYGFGTSIVKEVVGFGNAQNGILHLIVQYGLIGAISFIMLIIQTIKPLQTTNNEKCIFPILAFVIAFLFCSFVEICFDYNFLFALGIIMGFNNLNLKKDVVIK